MNGERKGKEKKEVSDNMLKKGPYPLFFAYSWSRRMGPTRRKTDLFWWAGGGNRFCERQESPIGTFVV